MVSVSAQAMWLYNQCTQCIQSPPQGTPICKLQADSRSYWGPSLAVTILASIPSPWIQWLSGKSIWLVFTRSQVQLPADLWISFPLLNAYNIGIITQFLANQLGWEAVWTEWWLKPTSQSWWKLDTCPFLVLCQSPVHWAIQYSYS